MSWIRTIKEHRLLIAAVVAFSFATKWVLIHFGYPHQTHVDEMTILKDPLRWLLLYGQGNLSKPTNLLNWLYLLWTGVLFGGGLLFGQWHNPHEFLQYLYTEDISFVIWGRVLSVLLSTAGNVVFALLARRCTRDRWLRAAFIFLFVLNPFELNSTNFIKFDAISYLLYAIILYQAHGYFLLGERHRRRALYLALFIGMATRIEIIGFLIGVSVLDFFHVYRGLPWPQRLRAFLGPYTVGIGLYCLLTLMPVAIVYNCMHPAAPDTRTIMPTHTFEEVIVDKFPHDAASFMATMGQASFYGWCALALLGPVVLVLFVAGMQRRMLLFATLAAGIILLALALDQVKSTFYFLAVSVVMLYMSSIVLARMRARGMAVGLALFNVLWVGSFSTEFFVHILRGDPRIPSADYLLAHTTPADRIYTDGLYNFINNTPAWYASITDAIQQAGGSTGLTTAYRATHTDPRTARPIMGICDCDFFKGTAYEGVFNNWYDPQQLIADDPLYYVLVVNDYWRVDDLLHRRYFGPYKSYSSYYDTVLDRYHLERTFSAGLADPRLRYRTHYYLQTTLILRRNGR